MKHQITSTIQAVRGATDKTAWIGLSCTCGAGWTAGTIRAAQSIKARHDEHHRREA